MLIICNLAYSIKLPINNEMEAVAYAQKISKQDKNVSNFIKLWEKRGYKIKYFAYFNKATNTWVASLVPENVDDVGYSIIFTSSGKIIEKSESKGG